ncbi:hypothetical protein [Metapseudomonas otitidis]|uniref:hypothetical protein n=1 Tax=Metapseudomonas otitidis TaxID=319939 RepID=UPI0013F5F9FB|nr:MULTISPECIES: hypothetical protein [Pseudomonas]MDL5595983.1 hypothetical protein [Bacillus subtilis]
MPSSATSIKSIKFYCQVPKIIGGQLQGNEIKATFIQGNEDQRLSYRVDNGAVGLLFITHGDVSFVYKLNDILGRIEVTA